MMGYFRANFLGCVMFMLCFYAGTAHATLVRTEVAAQIDYMQFSGTGGLDIGDTVSFTFLYDDGGISHQERSDPSAPFRNYSAPADVVLDENLVSWMDFYSVDFDRQDNLYGLYEPDGTELDEFFIAHKSEYYLSAGHDFYGPGWNDFYLQVTYLSVNSGQYENVSLEGHLLSVQTTPVPEPASALLFISGIFCCCCWEYKRRV